jgi:hypothetical protein
MNQQQWYVAEKLSELDALRRRSPLPPEQRPRRKARPLAPVVRAAGRRVRRIGEVLEQWASPAVAQDASR